MLTLNAKLENSSVKLKILVGVKFRQLTRVPNQDQVKSGEQLRKVSNGEDNTSETELISLIKLSHEEHNSVTSTFYCYTTPSFPAPLLPQINGAFGTDLKMMVP